MGTRLELHEEFCGLLGSRYVYFQPPEDEKMHYPCIEYNLLDIEPWFADDKTYVPNKAYAVTVMDENPDSSIYERLINHFPKCRFTRFFTSDNLNHWNFILFY